MTRIYSTGQVAMICAVSPRTINHWFDAGRLKGYRTSAGQRRIPHDDLVCFLETHGLDPAEMRRGLTRRLTTPCDPDTDARHQKLLNSRWVQDWLGS